EFGYLALCFLTAGLVFYRSYREAPSGVMRQQLKWLTGGTLAGSLPVSLLYILPLVMGVTLRPWMQLSVLSLVLIPLCFGYAIIRYRLMDVDIIFQPGLAYTAATAGLAALAGATCPFDVGPSFRVFEREFPRAGPAPVWPRGALFGVGPRRTAR